MGATRISQAIRQANAEGRPALVAFVTAGFPLKEAWVDVLMQVAEVADVVEIGVPFSDPMADGVTIQRSSHAALEQGVSLAWILDTLRALPERPASPLLLMSYLNPLFAFGMERLASASAEADVDGFIVPDLPLEECGPLKAALDAQELGLVQLVTPVTPAERMKRLVEESSGFVYAVTVTGITGGNAGLPPETADYLARIREASETPVCAGFGIRSPEQVAALGASADGLIVGSALIEVLEQGGDAAAFLQTLRAGYSAEPRS